MQYLSKFSFSILFLISNIYFATGQGEILANNQSGAAFYFSSSKNLKSLNYSYTSKRIFEIGIGAYQQKTRGFRGVSNNLGFIGHLAGFLNTGSYVNIKGSFLASRIQGGTDFGIAITIFGNGSNGNSRIVPSISLARANGKLGYIAGLDFKLGTEFNLVGGINYSKFTNESDHVFGLVLGFMFAETKPTLNKI